MANTAQNAEWIAPQIFRGIDNEAELNDAIKYTNAQNVINPIDFIADDLFELHHPEMMHDDVARAEYVASVVDQGPGFGTWVHYPWSSSLVHIADSEDHYDVRTYRNRNLVTEKEQQALRMTRVAVFGLSVGSNVVDRVLQSGIGDQYLLGDFDRLSLANLNRIQASVADLGLLKTTIAGRKMSLLDPYVEQHHSITGYDDNTSQVLRDFQPDIIIEEVDNLKAKARLRQDAKELQVPLVMAGDVGDRSTLDIERHDLGEVLPFNGKLTSEEFSLLLAGGVNEKLPQEQELGLLIKMLGQENISKVLFESVMLKGKELAGIPQLGTAAAIGGAITAVAVREILLGNSVGSSANIFDVRDFVGTHAVEMLS